MLTKTSKIKFLDGNEMPIIGYGCSSKATKPGEVEKGVRVAIEAGYCCLDTAQIYQNEEEVGAAIAAKIADGTVTRQELFVVTKVFQTFNRRSDVMVAAKASLVKLRLDYVDLLLVHSTGACKRESDNIMPAKNEDGSLVFDDVDVLETWQGMEAVQAVSLAKSIGLSNFNEAQVQRIWDHGKIKPQCLQVEQHIYFPQEALLAFCAAKGIAVTGYATLGSPGRLKHQWSVSSNAWQVDPGNLMEEPRVLKVANKLGRTPAQVLLRWSVQKGVAVIPKSNTPERIRQNIEIDFELTPENVELLDHCETRQRLFFYEWLYEHPAYPWKAEWEAERAKTTNNA